MGGMMPLAIWAGTRVPSALASVRQEGPRARQGGKTAVTNSTEVGPNATAGHGACAVTVTEKTSKYFKHVQNFIKVLHRCTKHQEELKYINVQTLDMEGPEDWTHVWLLLTFTLKEYN